MEGISDNSSDKVKNAVTGMKENRNKVIVDDQGTNGSACGDNNLFRY
jgi:hypothetical protein